MPTMTTKTAPKVTLVSAKQKYSNEGTENGNFRINVEVEIKNGKYTGNTNGNMSKVSDASLGNANFSSGKDNSHFSFNANDMTKEETKAAFMEALDFIDAVESTINSQSE